MLAVLRRAAATWPARILFLVLVVAFASWGAGNVLRNFGQQDPAVAATVGHERVTTAELTLAYNRQLAQVSQMLGGDAAHVPLQLRRAIAEQAAQRLVIQAALTVEAQRMGLAVPDDALRRAVFAIPAFHGTNGQFDRATFNSVLQANGLTEARFLDLMRRDLLQQQLMAPITAGFAAPGLLTTRVFDYEAERRVADLVSLPFAAAPPAAAPDQATLQRWYDDHPAAFATPAYRRVRIVLLSADTIAQSLPVDPAALQRAFDAERATLDQPERRSLEILTAPTEAAAQTLAAAWRAGASWDAVSAQATRAGATALTLPRAAEVEIPDAALAQAAFAAAPGAITGPVADNGRFAVLSVTAIAPAVTPSFASQEPTLRRQATIAQAQSLLPARADKLQDALAGGAGFDQLPGDLGLAAVAGTLDAAGNTPDGTPAPIPGTAAQKQAIVAHAFAQAPGPASALIDGPGQSYYAVQVEAVIPAGKTPFTEAEPRVLADWRADAARRAQNIRATAIMTAVNSGHALAAAAAPLPVTALPPVGRQGDAQSGAQPGAQAGAQGVAPQLIPPLFALAPGQATMVETPTGFLVAQLRSVQHPSKADNPAGYADIRHGLDQALGQDAQVLFASAVGQMIHPRINAEAVASIVQPNPADTGGDQP